MECGGMECGGEKMQIFEIVFFYQLKKEIIFFICVASLQIFLLNKNRLMRRRFSLEALKLV